MDYWIYFGLFISCFLSATLIPLASEVGLSVLIAQGFDPILVVLLATFGNSLGGTTNYFIGRLGNPEWLKKGKLNSKRIEKISKYIHKYGSYCALFSWLPIVGDPFLLVLGFMRAPMFLVFFFMVIGKLFRYIVIAYLSMCH
jgi:membrane protein YqaA with SNARE-associated domain